MSKREDIHTELYVELGIRVRAAREDALLSQGALAQKSGLHRNTVYKLEHGLGSVDLETLLAVSEALGTNFIAVFNSIVDELSPLKLKER